jgi:hypothetical protein
MKDDKLPDEICNVIEQFSIYDTHQERCRITENGVKALIDLIRGSDRELLKIAYSQLQDSSNAYDNGCNIIRKMLEPSPPTTNQ